MGSRGSPDQEPDPTWLTIPLASRMGRNKVGRVVNGGGLSSSASRRDSGDGETGHTEIDKTLILTATITVSVFSLFKMDQAQPYLF